MLQPITPPPTITTWARLGKSVGMSRPFLVVMITAIPSTGCPRWSRHVPGGGGGGRARAPGRVQGGCRRPVRGWGHGDPAGQHGDQLRGPGEDDPVLDRGAGPETVVHRPGR